MEPKTTLIVKAKHFENTTFAGVVCGCALEKAAMDQFNIPRDNVAENVTNIQINGQTYSHDWFGIQEFDEMRAIALSSKHPETVVGQIELTPINTEFQYL